MVMGAYIANLGMPQCPVHKHTENRPRSPCPHRGFQCILAASELPAVEWFEPRI